MNKLKVFACVVIVVLVASFIGYRTLGSQLIVYDNPREAFDKSASRGAKLLEILESNGVALVIYQNKDGDTAQKLLAEDNGSWSSMKRDYECKNSKMIKDGFVYNYEINGSNVINVVMSVSGTAKEDISVIDSAGKEYSTYVCENENGKMLVYSLFVTDEKLPDDYKVYIGDYEIEIQ